MTHADFCNWLSGYLDGCGYTPDLALIRKKLGEAHANWANPPALMRPTPIYQSAPDMTLGGDTVPAPHPTWGYPIVTCSQVTPVTDTFLTN